MNKTVLNAAHQRHGARLVEFGGFEMPVWYSGLTDEHHAVRQRAGVFDLCHMGRFEIVGDDPVAALDRVVTQDVSRMKKGQVRYSLVCNDEGGVLDDILIYRLPDRLWLVVNAGNRQKLLHWFGERLVGAKVIDHSEELAMVALCSAPGWRRLAQRSIRPGQTILSLASMLVQLWVWFSRAYLHLESSSSRYLLVMSTSTPVVFSMEW
jgi:hypothetical protein